MYIPHYWLMFWHVHVYAHKNNVLLHLCNFSTSLSHTCSHCWCQLRRVNGSMNEYVSNLNSSTPTTTLYHTLQRHNEILQDYSQEFNRTKVDIHILNSTMYTTGHIEAHMFFQSNILAQRQREELLGTSRKEGFVHVHVGQQAQS